MVLLVAWLWTTEATAQTLPPTGSVYGTALDPEGRSVNGVTVALTGPGAAQTANTDSNGDFRFLNLSPGDYFVRFERTGFESMSRELTIVPGRSVVLSITMPVAGATESVIVRGDVSGLDSRRVQTGAAFGQKELESIPTTRDPWAFLRQVPGILIRSVNVGGGRNPRQPLFVGKGSSPGQNTYNLDGVPISLGGVSPMYYDFDSFSNIEIATGGSDPALSTPGVALNLVTKRGTNLLRGSARGLYTGGAGWDYGIEAGGPVWKDHLWLWGAASRNAFLGDTLFNDIGETVRVQETLKYWNGKLNAELVPANTLTLSYTNFDRISLGRGAGSDVSQPSTTDNTLASQAYGVADSHVLSPSSFASIYLSYVTATAANTPQGSPDEQADLDIDGIWRHSNASWRIQDIKHQSGLNASTFFDTGNMRHELKFGFGYRHIRFDSASSWPGDRLVGLAPYQIVSITRVKDVNSIGNAYDAFLSDTIQSGHLTVSVSARFDYQQGKNLPSAVPANPVFPRLLPAVQYAGDTGYPITWREVEPRVGVTYALGGNRTLLRASYARFTSELDSFTILSVNAFPSIASLDYSWSDGNGNGRVEPEEVGFFWDWPCCGSGVDPANPGSSVQINRISKDLEPPTTDEFIIGVERQIATDLSGSVAYTYRVTRNLEFAPLIGTTRASYEYLGNATGIAEAKSNGFVLDFSEPYYGLTECFETCVGTLLQNRPDANETYRGVELQFVKSFSHGWMARVSFAYNDWQQQIGSGAIVNPNNETPGTDASGPVVLGGINATWQFNVSGMVELPLGVAAGVNLFGRQGFPTPYWVNVLTNDLIYNIPAIQIGDAARYRTPNVYELDLQLSKTLRIGSAILVSPQFACFNLLNSHTVLEREGEVGWYDSAAQTFEASGGFNAERQVLSSRVFRGGVRISF